MKKNVNNGVFYVVISLVAVLAISSVVYAYALTQNINVAGDYNNYEAEGNAPAEINENYAAMPGGDIYQRINMHAGYQYGGSVYATSSTASSYTLVATEFKDDIYYIDWTPNVNTTLTLMATTSADIEALNIPNAGDTREYILANASSTAAASITLAAGTGIDLQYDEDSANLAIVGLDAAKLTFIRKPNTDVLVLLTEFTEAD